MPQPALVMHFLRRNLTYNVPLSLLASSLVLFDFEAVMRRGLIPTLFIFSIFFTFSAATGGFAIGLFVYFRFHSYELPLYINGGIRLPKLIAVSWVCLLILCCLLIMLLSLFRSFAE